MQKGACMQYLQSCAVASDNNTRQHGFTLLLTSQLCLHQPLQGVSRRLGGGDTPLVLVLLLRFLLLRSLPLVRCCVLLQAEFRLPRISAR